MRTGERRLAARAWLGAASSARANAHRAAAIVAYKLDFYDSVSATAMPSVCVIQSQSLLALLASKSIDASSRLQSAFLAVNSAHASPVHQQTITFVSHSSHARALCISARLARRRRNYNTRTVQPWQGGPSPSGPPSHASRPSRPDSPDKRSDIKQPSRTRRLLQDNKLCTI